MPAIETSKTGPRALSGEANGRIWEPQCAASYHAVFDKAPVGSTTRLFDAGCGAGMAMLLAAELGAEVAGIDASARLLKVACDRLPAARLE